jgi:subtilase family serine protease
VEWASAAAPNATIELASCADTRTNFGGFIALQNLLASSNPPAIVSISYGEAETQNGQAGNAYINSLFATAAAEGVSVFVAAGDEGAASADSGATSATHGISVSAYASTPNNVAVGGTDFGDAYLNDVNTYWNTTNGTYFNSALSYIPEIPWNGSCASQLLATALGFSTAYGSNGLCASTTAQSDGLLEVAAGSGGPSNCATGTPAQSGVAGGTCKGYVKPSWQNVAGNPADGVRDIPDVSMFASNGIWGHYYVVCYSDPGRNRGGSPCTGAPSNWAGFGGTSVASPVMAAVQALIDQKMNGRQGNPNATLYSLARSAFGTAGNGSCNSSNGAGTCAFHDVTLGDMDVNCSLGTPDCYDPGGSTGGSGRQHRGGFGGGSGGGGVLSTSTSSYQPAFGTSTGWDYATGLGSVNVYLLLTDWP